MRRLIIIVLLCCFMPLSFASLVSAEDIFPEIRSTWNGNRGYLELRVRNNQDRSISESSPGTVNGVTADSGADVVVENPGPSVADLVAGYQRMLELMTYDWCEAIDVAKATVSCVSSGVGIEVYNPLHVDSGDPSGDAGLSFEAVSAVVQESVARLYLPSPDVIFGPDPANNEWGALAIGLPIWLRNSNVERVIESVSSYGVDISIEAVPVRHVFDMGNGDQVSCVTMAVNPGRFDGYIPPASPDCGYTYLEGTGRFVVTSTTFYEVNWAAAGYSGVLQVSTSGSRELEIIELHTVVVR